jgi:hypothetical protein
VERRGAGEVHVLQLVVVSAGRKPLVQEAVASAGDRVSLGRDERAVDLGVRSTLGRGAVEVEASVVDLGARLSGQVAVGFRVGWYGPLASSHQLSSAFTVWVTLVVLTLTP